MSQSGIDELFDGAYGYGASSWWDSISPEAQAWCQELAAEAAARGREPVWRRTFLRFRERFPADAPKSETTIKTTMRRLLAELDSE
ncbi:MAG: hypothetical protein ACE5F5_13530 [Acidimicrobiia bacterium]